MTLFPGVALITGAASGIGRQTAISFAVEGCRKLALVDLDDTGLAETARLCREAAAEVEAITLPADVSDEASITRAVGGAVEKWGRIDYAVNCAGIFALTGPSHQVDAAQWDRTMAVNARGIWLTSRAEIIQMMKQDPLLTHDGRPGNRGAVVNIASNLGLISRADCPAYNASKAAVVSMTRSDAIDYGSHNIRVNCVCPGVIDTPMTKDVPRDDPAISISPIKRIGAPQEVADTALFLASAKASYISGHALAVDGGAMINYA